MDSNRDGFVTADEFQRLSLGLLPVARRQGRVQQYAAARERIWRRWAPAGRKVMPRTNYQAGARGELYGVAGAGLNLSFEEFKQARFVRDLAVAAR